MCLRRTLLSQFTFELISFVSINPIFFHIGMKFNKLKIPGLLALETLASLELHLNSNTFAIPNVNLLLNS